MVAGGEDGSHMLICLGSLQVTAHVRRIEAVEKDLKALSHNAASKDDLSRVRAEVKKLYDGLHIGMFSLRRVLAFPEDFLSHRIPRFEKSCVGNA